MFHIRENLHRLAYKHQVTVAVELMLAESLVKANEYVYLAIIDRVKKTNASVLLKIL